VSIYTNNEYESSDLDFISPESTSRIAEVIASLGLKREGRMFSHARTPLFVEFPAGPLADSASRRRDRACRAGDRHDDRPPHGLFALAARDLPSPRRYRINAAEPAFFRARAEIQSFAHDCSSPGGPQPRNFHGANRARDMPTMPRLRMLTATHPQKRNPVGSSAACSDELAGSGRSFSTTAPPGKVCFLVRDQDCERLYPNCMGQLPMILNAPAVKISTSSTNTTPGIRAVGVYAKSRVRTTWSIARSPAVSE
jgi:hypothetical protein